MIRLICSFSVLDRLQFFPRLGMFVISVLWLEVNVPTGVLSKNLESDPGLQSADCVCPPMK